MFIDAHSVTTLQQRHQLRDRMRLIWNLEEDITTLDDVLLTNVMLSLFTDKRALDSDELPHGGTDKRGYWADSFNDDNYKIGSRLWLLSREKQLDSVLKRAKEYAEESLKWLIDEKQVESITVTATKSANNTLLLIVKIQRNKNSNAEQITFNASLKDV